MLCNLASILRKFSCTVILVLLYFTLCAQILIHLSFKAIIMICSHWFLLATWKPLSPSTKLYSFIYMHFQNMGQEIYLHPPFNWITPKSLLFMVLHTSEWMQKYYVWRSQWIQGSSFSMRTTHVHNESCKCAFMPLWMDWKSGLQTRGALNRLLAFMCGSMYGSRFCYLMF